MSSGDKPFGVPGTSLRGGADGRRPAPPTRRRSQAAKAANRFDIRRLIGGLFVLYGLILLIARPRRVPPRSRHKAAGINVDLWTGLGMLVFGALMIFWALSQPVMPEPPETRGEGSGRIRRAPAT